ncbi:hypothetical protein MMC27_000187 [Xylographa pallens]|nr:hypothetical protein [Xylographa pallens]
MAEPAVIGLRIPEELISIIIQHTDDVETRQNWCVATFYHRNLYKVALRKRWASITINHDDLIASPNEVQLPIKQGSHFQHIQSSILSKASSRNNLVNGTGIINLATKTPRAGPIPATQITTLVLDFRFNDDAERPEYKSGGDNEGLPGDALEHSLALLFQHLEKVEAITVDCIMPQEMLKAITDFTNGHLKILKIRIIPTTAYFCSPGRNGLCQQYLLNWEGLQRMQSLEVLEIRELAFGEGHGLALAVRELTSLKRLLVKSDDRCAHDPSPLQDFFDQTFPTSSGFKYLSKTCGLPKNLESLVLIDSYYTGSRRAQVRSPPPGYHLSYPPLTEISLDLHDRKSCFNLIEWVPKSALSTIKIPSNILTRRWRLEPDHLAAISPGVRFVNTFINDSQSVLSELVLMDAWDMIPIHWDYLNKAFENHFAMEELVLGTQDPWDFRGNNDMVGSRTWGSRIKRLRIEHLTLGQIKLDWLSSSAWAHLRVLMLNSLQASPLKSHLKQSRTMARFPESRLAMDVALKHVADLRVVVVGAFQFWIHRASAPVVMYFTEAQRHPDYRAEVESWLTARDRSFLEGDVSYVSMQCRINKVPVADTVRLSNYLVLRRLTGD